MMAVNDSLILETGILSQSIYEGLLSAIDYDAASSVSAALSTLALFKKRLMTSKSIHVFDPVTGLLVEMHSCAELETWLSEKFYPELAQWFREIK